MKNISKFKDSNAMKIIIIIAVIIIPILYSFFYLKAFWNPYGNLHDMKIAIVNLDEGDNNERLGEELVNKLKDKDVMSLAILNNSDEAQEGLINQDYYATITIPKNFTQNLNNAENSDRQVTTITYSPNQKSNYLASQIINKVVTTVETELRSEVSKKVVEKLTDKLEEVPNKMAEISDGAGQIQNGTSKLETGLEKLKDGTNNLSTNYEKFDNGVDTAYNGSVNLNEGIDKLNLGANDLSTGINNYVDGTNTVISGISTTKAQIQTLASYLQAAASNPNVISDPNFQKALQQLQIINTSNTNTEGLKALQTAGPTLKQGAGSLKQGLNTAKVGSQNLEEGLKTLSTNSKTIKNGTKELNDGTTQALDGSKELLNGVDTFRTEIDNGITDTKEQLKKLDGLDDYVSEPVKIEETDYAQVDSYGVGFAPYFMSISLWVGALIMLIIFYYDPEDRFKLLGRNSKNKYLRSVLYFAISITQGIVLGFILKVGLGFGVTNIWLYYASCVLTSIVFFSILQFLVIKLGDVGKFLGILLLVLQLAASGGTFPIETVPNFFRAIYNFMPMNYTIRLIKESLIKIDSGMIAKNAGILIGIFVVFLMITIAIDYIKNRIDKEKAKTAK